jgi:hypothetical protein
LVGKGESGCAQHERELHFDIVEELKKLKWKVKSLKEYFLEKGHLGRNLKAFYLFEESTISHKRLRTRSSFPTCRMQLVLIPIF